MVLSKLMETAHVFKIKFVLKRFPGSEPDSAEQCSCANCGDCVRCYFSSAEGCCSRNKAHHVAGADVGLKDDIGI